MGKRKTCRWREACKGEMLSLLKNIGDTGVGGNTSRLDFILFLKRFYLFIFREREREREREGEKHQCVVASCVTPSGSATQARALTVNRTGDPLVHRPAINPLSPTSPSWTLNKLCNAFGRKKHKGLLFNTQSGHMPRLCLQSLAGACTERQLTDVSLSH